MFLQEDGILPSSGQWILFWIFSKQISMIE
jgi:hypothetical protein